jgi:glyoxylase-like metal-dependent hydrolase (beta-lactamase superfamily II)
LDIKKVEFNIKISLFNTRSLATKIMTQLKTQEYAHNITCIDTEYVRSGLASCYLIEQNNHAAFIDTGTFHTVPLLLQALKEKNIPIENVDYVIPTHVHLDHAGGAGELMRQLPNAKLVIHPRGAKHMTDPSRLQAGASAVYGEAMFKQHYGELIPIPEERVIIPDDDSTIDFRGRPLTFLHTPGHAKHHFCIIDPTSNGMFTGDTFGVAYPELDGHSSPYIFPPSSPVDFDPEDWIDSIHRLMATKSKYAYLTHFGKVGNLQPLAETLIIMVNEFAELAQTTSSPAALHTAVKEHMLQGVVSGGCTLPIKEIDEILSIDMDLIAQGLTVWVEKQPEK